MALKYRFIILVAGALCACASEPSYSDAGEGEMKPVNIADESPEMIPGWIRIKLSDDAAWLRTGKFTRGECVTGNMQFDALALGLGVTEIKRVFAEGGKFSMRRRRHGLHLWYDLHIDESVPLSRAAEEMAVVEGVDMIEPIYRTRLAAHQISPDFSDRLYKPSEVWPKEEDVPFDDPELGKQWHYHNDGSLERSVAGADINLFRAWREWGAGRPEVIVAVIDGGIQYDHSDLAANMWINRAELNGTVGVDDDGNGYTDDIYGWNYFTGTGGITPHYHGTHVAGTIAAVNNNQIGVCGVAGGTGAGDGVRLMSCQGYSIIANGETDGTIDPDSFAYAADNGAVIAQNSWGYSGISMPASMREAILYFIQEAGTDENGVQTGPMKGGLVCFSAGNSGFAYVNEPADMKEVIAVTAMEPDYTKAYYSNYGTAADIFAPGGAASNDPLNPRQVYSTYPDDGYAYLWGTSMACPHVSGVAALIVSRYGVDNPGFTAEKCREILLRSYRPVGDYLDTEVAEGIGVGLIDASLIALEDPQMPPAPVEELELVPLPDNIQIRAAIPGDGNGDAVLKIYIEYGPVETAQSGESISRVFHNSKPPGSMFETQLELTAETSYKVSVYTEDRFGNCSKPVSAVETTLPHINMPPTYSPIDNQRFAAPGIIFKKTIALGEYFTDPDIPYGDELTFDFESSRPQIVEISLQGASLVLNPKYRGETFVTVFASDRSGATVSGSFTAFVASGDTPPDNPPGVDPDPPVTEPGEGALRVYPSPSEEELRLEIPGCAHAMVNVTVYDAAARKVLYVVEKLDENAQARLDVSNLSPGHYTVATSCGGQGESASFLKR